MQRKISSIIIAKNEEVNIKRCIESQLDCVDDIVVIVDSASEDKTYEVASSFSNVNCIRHDWLGYSATKQLALEKTEHDWVLWIDADEQLTKELIDEINKLKQIDQINFSAYQIARRAYFLGKWIKYSGWYPGYVTRFFNKNYASFNAKNVHEGLNVSGRIGKLESDLNHYTDPTISHYFKKFDRYTTLAADELFNKGKSASMSDLILRPFFIFFKMYILRKGFMDGFHGFILAAFSSMYVFTKYAKLWELNKRI